MTDESLITDKKVLEILKLQSLHIGLLFSISLI